MRAVEDLAHQLCLHPDTVEHLAGATLRKLDKFDSLSDVRSVMHPVTFQQFMYNLSHVNRSQVVYDIAMRRVAARRSGLSMLDVGCGLGGALIVFGKAGFKVHGIELNDSLRALCEKNLSFNGVGGDLSKEDICVDDLGGRRYDVIICNSVVEHVIDPPRFITNIGGLLAPGGVLVIGVANCEALGVVISDPHYQLFGMTLLPQAKSAKMYDIFAKIKQKYSVTDWYPIRDYKRMIEKSAGPVELIPPTDEKRDLDAVPGLIARVASGLEESLGNSRLRDVPELRDDLRIAAGRYMAAVCDQYAAALVDGNHSNFVDRFIRKSFQLVATKY